MLAKLNTASPSPLGVIVRSSSVAVVTSKEAPEKMSPVDPIVLLVNTSFPASVARVPVVGSVTPVVPVVVSVSALAPTVVNAPAKEIVVLLGIVSVPVVLVTVRPPTVFALKAYGTEANRIRGSISPSPLNSTVRYQESSLKSREDIDECVPKAALNIPSVTAI